MAVSFEDHQMNEVDCKLALVVRINWLDLLPIVQSDHLALMKLPIPERDRCQ